MRQLIKQREIVVDTWKTAEEDAAASAVIVPLAQFQAERDQWLASGKNLGVRLGAADPVESIVADLPKLSLVAFEFGGLAEGRGYSNAQLLRSRHNFKGEVRAVGKIQRDQVFYMARCGFDAFEFPEGTDLNVALTAFKDFDVAYQTSADQGVQLRKRAI